MNVNAILEQTEKKEILRFSTAGSVDDGKSTLIGRLLHDSKNLLEDQLSHIQGKSNQDEPDWALLTDGLKAEREQGITIDVAYRYFTTPKRKFIIADTPGHEQYTRNMATGASTADLAIVLVDARHGLRPQSKRHAFIAGLMHIPHLVVAVNKMDLVDYDQAVFEKIKADFTAFSTKLRVHDVRFVPISALKGDNVVEPGGNMPWYTGKCLLDILEEVHIAGDRNYNDFRFPVQLVLRPDQNFRGYAGQVASGFVRKGDPVTVLPSMKQTKVASIETFTGPLDEAFAGMSVTLTLTDEVDISRGDILVPTNNLPRNSHRLDAKLVWFDEQPARQGQGYLMQLASQTVRVVANRIKHRVDVNNLEHEAVHELGMNDIGLVELTSFKPVIHDLYRRNRQMGGFILVDPLTNRTVAAGMIVDSTAGAPDQDRRHVVAAERGARWGHRPMMLWLSGSYEGRRSQFARLLERRLFDLGGAVMVLDARLLREVTVAREGSPADPAGDWRRFVEAARLLQSLGIAVIAAPPDLLQGAGPDVKRAIGADKFRRLRLVTDQVDDQDGTHDPLNGNLLISHDPEQPENGLDAALDALRATGFFIEPDLGAGI